ncbi:hypothetical protein CPC08DRAFT_799885 [Agrocybe pediades]|nr:hypothetical protein CPC08DRAFT_799885 [Agrocybe pediades]
MGVGIVSDSYETLYDRIRSEFSDQVPAAALLWWWLDTADKFGVRVEVPTLGKEFSNGMYIGRDPEGTLFFNDPDDFHGENSSADPLKCKYDVYYNNNASSPAFVIQWYTTNASEAFAKFVAKDPNRVAKNLINSADGSWSDANASESFARITKQSSSNTWTMTIPSIHKKVTLPTNSASITNRPAHNQRVDTMGILVWKDINKIEKGVYADYRDDRIVFTETNEWSVDFCAFFLPLEWSRNLNPLGPYVIGAGGAKWENM